ncbi:MAG: hypothetical protein LBR80_18720 [Deltaproteobacteria bacterium]|nr:hypothetical protein [Deltaproteobacteria bacterium]
MNGTAHVGPRHAETRWLSASAVYASIVSLAFMAVFLYFCGAGLDFADEGSYLLFIGNPDDYDLTVTQFGYLLGPLFDLIGRDVFLLRVFSAMVLAGASLIFFLLALSRCSAVSRRDSLPLAAVCAASIASFYSVWRPTPGYNTLNVIGLLLVASGMLLALPAADRSFGEKPAVKSASNCSARPGKNTDGRGAGDVSASYRGRPASRALGKASVWLMIGAGGWLCFMAKPPTAAALGILVLVWGIFAKSYRPPWIVLAVWTALALCLLSAWLIDGSPQEFVSRYGLWIQESRNTGAGTEYGIEPLSPEVILRGVSLKRVLGAISVFLAGGLMAYLAALKGPRPYSLFLGLAALAFFGVLIADLGGRRYVTFQGMVLMMGSSGQILPS